MAKKEENLPVELYGVLAELLNRKNNMVVLDSIRGEYGVLNCLMELEDGASAGELGKRQIMDTMKAAISVPREGEMFFQYQADLINVPMVGNAPAKQIHLQLDSLPFHM